MTDDPIVIDKETARKFLLMKQGLFGSYIFEKKTGALEYVRQAGCIQFDPVDSVGKNAELTLQSRVKGFRKKDLYDLLYRDRSLVDYFDKELAIIPTEDWKFFKRYRELCRMNGERFEGLKELEEEAIAYISKHGNVSSSTLPIEGGIRWHSSIHWSGNWHDGLTKASRSVLEQLYTTGDLIIHHKAGTRKYYDLAEKYIPAGILNAEDPFPDTYDHIRWRIKRRIGAVGMLWNRNSPAFLGIPDIISESNDPSAFLSISALTAENRNKVFEDLLSSGEIKEVHVEGIRFPFCILTEDLSLLEEALKESSTSTRCEFLAPLDPFLWDRQLIERIFDFKYSWEIYTPKENRQYGYYVLPIINGDRFVGRIEPVIRDGKLIVNDIWFEPGIRKTKKLLKSIDRRLERFAKFNDSTYERGCEKNGR